MEISKEHQEKYAGFIEMCQTQWVDHVVISELRVIWDNIKELTTNLHLLQQHWKILNIANENLRLTISQP